MEKKRNPLLIVLALSAVFFVLFLVISAALFLKKPSESSRWSNWEGSGETRASGGSDQAVAVIELKGVILDSKKILGQLKRAAKNTQVKAVVLRLNSPGGAVAPSQEIYDAVKKFPKPIFSSMASVAASGAYYIASGTKVIYANAGTLTGSIGVIMEFANLEKLYQWAKIERYSVKTGKYKDTGSENRAMTADERKLLQAMIDDVLGQFKGAVAEGRSMKPAEVDAVADGRIFSGAQAKALRLVDELGGIEDAILAAAKAGGIKGEPRVIYPHESQGWLRDILSGGEDEEASSSISQLVSAIIPGGISGSIQTPAPGLFWIWHRP